jgi:hypothetical protein
VRWWHQVFNRTDDEMNEAINASIATAQRVAAYSSGLSETAAEGGDGTANQAEGTSQDSASPQPPGLTASQSVLTGVETAHEALTPDDRAETSLNRSASVGMMPAALGTLQDKLSGLTIGKGVFGGAGGSPSTGRNRPGAHNTEFNSPPGDKDSKEPEEDGGGQEMKSMD